MFKKENIELMIISPKEGEKITLANKRLSKWISNYKPYSNKYSYLKGDNFKKKNILFKWKCNVPIDKYILRIKEEVTNIEQVFEVNRSCLKISDLNVNSSYIWSVEAITNNKILSKISCEFYTLKTPKFIKVNGVLNFRDIAFFSNTLKQGMIFRSARLEEISKCGKAKIKSLKIKTDIDLREPAEGLAGIHSPIENINYYCLPGAYYVDSDAKITDPKYQANLVKIIKILSNEENYPVVIHCAIGRDRTGTLAAIIEALLGATYEDILIDYSASFFSEASKIDNANPIDMTNKILEVYDYLNNYSNSSLSENCEKFLIDIGAEKISLDKIKLIMKK